MSQNTVIRTSGLVSFLIVMRQKKGKLLAVLQDSLFPDLCYID